MWSVLLEIMFEKSSLKCIQRSRVCLRFIMLLGSSEHRRQPGLLHVLPWQSPYFISQLAALPTVPAKSSAPSILSPQLPASALCALFSDPRIEENS